MAERFIKGIIQSFLLLREYLLSIVIAVNEEDWTIVGCGRKLSCKNRKKN